MKQISTIIFLVLSLNLISQNTLFKVNTNSIGVNIANPSKYFHLEVPGITNIDGFYSHVNYTGSDDIHALEGHSICSAGYGIGGHFTGGFQGVYALGNGGASNDPLYPTYGLYAEAIGTSGKRIGLFAQASGGLENLAARFGLGDVEIQNRLRINTTIQSGRVNIENAQSIGSTATALRIQASNTSTSTVYGTLVVATHTGTGNVFGHYAAVSANGSNNKAYALYGEALAAEDFALYGLGNGYISGDLRIGQNVDPYSGAYKVVVDGKILAEEVRIQNSLNWPDYVFSDTYNLKSLRDLEIFIKENKHLPNIPSAAEIEKDGISLGEMQIKMMEKLEELTLHIIAQQKEIDVLKLQIINNNDEK